MTNPFERGLTDGVLLDLGVSHTHFQEVKQFSQIQFAGVGGYLVLHQILVSVYDHSCRVLPVEVPKHHLHCIFIHSIKEEEEEEFISSDN